MLLFAPPGALSNPTFNYNYLFTPDGFLVQRPAAIGTEPPNFSLRRVLDLTNREAIRLQFAHDLASGTIKVALQFTVDSGASWGFLIPQTGGLQDPNDNQASSWYAVPRFVGPQFLTRMVVYGDGQVSPRFRYITVDAR